MGKKSNKARTKGRHITARTRPFSKALRPQPAYRGQAFNLEPYIQLEQEKIGKTRSLFYGIRFNLDNNSLAEIQSAQATNQTIYIPRQLLADLRYHTLFSQDNGIRSGLTFCTYYHQGVLEEAVMRSLLSLDGDIIHQIKSDCLERPQFCQKMVSAHYWLIDQLLQQLRLRIVFWLEGISWGLSVLTVVLAAIPYIQPLLLNPITLLIPVLASWLLRLVLKPLLLLLLPFMRRWTVRQMLLGLLSHQSLRHRIAKGILARLTL
jgi:hypothetical protein